MKSSLDLADTQPIKKASRLLDEAGEAVQAGNEQQAYQLSLKATEAAPGYTKAWELRAQLAPSMEEKIACMNRLNQLQPNHQDHHEASFSFLEQQLKRDPFLGYLEETTSLYHVINKDHMVLSIPKGHAPMKPYPPEKAVPLTNAYRWLGLALFGIALAGIPTLFFAPLAARSAYDAKKSLRARSDQIHAQIVQAAAVILFIVGLLFSVLFALHLT